MRILAHRGSPGTTSVENTIPAVTGCLEAGADGIEIDLRLSSDGVLVVCHDPDLSRLTGLPLPLGTSTWDDLRAAADSRGVPLARVEWVLAAAAGSRVVLEVKAPPPGGLRPTVDAVVDRLCVLRDAGLPLDVTVSSFAPDVVAAVRAVAPASLGVRTALLGRPTVRPSWLVARALAAGHDEVHPHVAALLADPGAVAVAHRCGLAVVPWTVNRSRALRRLASLGVDAVISDSPVRARAALVTAGRLSAA